MTVPVRLVAGMAIIAFLTPWDATASTKTIYLDSRGQLIGVTPAINDGDEIRVCINGGTATKLTLQYLLRREIASPDRELFTTNIGSLKELEYCDSLDATKKDEARAPRVATGGYSLFAYWITGAADTITQAAKDARKARLTTLSGALEASQKKVDAAKTALAALAEEIKQLASAGTPDATNAILNRQADVRTQTQALQTATEELKKQTALGDLPDLVLLDADPPARKIFRLGAAIIGDSRRTVHYRIVRDGSVQQPLRLEPAGPFPVLTRADELFAVVNNVQPNVLPNRFALSFTSEVGKPPDPAPVRPSVDPPKLGAGSPPVTIAKELSTAYADSILSFGRPLKANEVIKTTITTYAESITTDKTTVTDDKPKTEVVKEMTNVKLVEAAEYPQVRDRYHFNLTTGVVSSNLRDPAFTKVKSAVGATDADTRYVVDANEGSRRAFPVLLFSFYWTPKDIQAPWSWQDLTPVPTIGFSLTTPKDDFFAGFQSEIRRNVHLVYGIHFGSVTMRSLTAVDEDRTSDAVLTHKAFDKEAFVGLSFNINFIKDLFIK